MYYSMEKLDFLKQCKLYKGQTECPAELNNTQYGPLFWDAERLYVEHQEPEFISGTVGAFLECGLAGEGSSLPIQLRACLFSVFCKGADNDPAVLANYFKTSVLPKYLALP